MSQAPPPATSDPNPTPVIPVCYRHPKRETYLRCVRCDRPICPECLREAPVGYQCPECVSEGRRSVRPSRTIFGGSTIGALGYVTTALIFINVAVMIASVVSAGGAGVFGGGMNGLLGGSTPLTEGGSVWGLAQFEDGRGAIVLETRAGISEGEYYRLLTSMFLHYGLIHLALNMWALWVLGRELEARLGPGRFLALYLLSGLGGSVAAYLVSPASQTAGASGAIYGLFAALFVVLKRLNRDTSSIIIVLVINLIFSFSVPGISIAGHLGGLAVGAAVGVAIAYPPREVRARILSITVGALVLLFAAAVIAKTASLSVLPPFPPGF
jgi:membrane associated rhomboid family serine protease